MQGSSLGDTWAFGKAHRPFMTTRKRRLIALVAATALFLVAAGAALANDKLTSDADLVATGLQRTYTNNSLAAGATANFSFSLYVEVEPGGNEPGYPIDIRVKSSPSWVAPVTSFPVSIVGVGVANAVSVTFQATGQASPSTGTIQFGAYPSGSTTELSQSLINTNAQSSFTVNVAPPAPPANTPPTLVLPADMTVEGNTTGGANVTYTATANDAEDGPLTPICLPASGSFFALGGPHAVNCSVTDSGGLTANGSFNVTVEDTTPPTLQNVPGNISATATSAAGAVVTYTDPTATDIVDPSPSVVCAPVSGSTFAPGTTTVTCTATDGSGNSSFATFDVTVTFAFYGFLRPVDNGVLNSMKGGSTAPIKWQVGDGAGGYIRDLAIVAKTQSGIQACSASAPVDNLEEYATGGTQLRYDLTAEQFIYNWQSPKKPGYCYQVRITLTDGMTYIAQFGLK